MIHKYGCLFQLKQLDDKQSLIIADNFLGDPTTDGARAGRIYRVNSY